jgi:hypothetical protein
MGSQVRAMVIAPGKTSGPRFAVGAGPYPLPRVLYDGSGRSTVFWSGDFREGFRYATRPAGGSFSAPTLVPSPSGAFEDPAYAVGAGGDALVAYRSYYSVYASMRSGDGGMGTPVLLNDPAQTSATGPPSVAVNARGDAMVAWAEQNPDGSADAYIRVRRRAKGEAWSPVETVLGKGIFGGIWPVSAALADDGTAAVLWPGGVTDTIYSTVTARVRPPGGPWGPYEAVSWDVGMELEFPKLSFGLDGRLLAAWRWYTSMQENTGVAAAASRGTDGRWRARALTDRQGNVWPPAMAVDGHGGGLLAWPRAAGAGDFRIELSRWDGASPEPPLTPLSDPNGPPPEPPPEPSPSPEPSPAPSPSPEPAAEPSATPASTPAPTPSPSPAPGSDEPRPAAVAGPPAPGATVPSAAAPRIVRIPRRLTRAALRRGVSVDVVTERAASVVLRLEIQSLDAARWRTFLTVRRTLRAPGTHRIRLRTARALPRTALRWRVRIT